MSGIPSPLRAVLLAAGGFLLVVVAVMWRDGSRYWGLTMDRQGAAQEARSLAPQVGVDPAEVAPWGASVVVRRRTSAEGYLAYQRRQGNPLAAPGTMTGQPSGIHPLTYEVELVEPEAVQALEVRLTGNGEPRALALRPVAPKEVAPEVADAKAQEGLRLLAGDQWQSFELFDSSRNRGVDTYRWRWYPESAEGLQMTARVEVRGERAPFHLLEPQLNGEMLEEVGDRGPLNSTFRILFVLAVLAYLIYTFLYHQPHRRAFMGGVLAAASALGWVILTFRHRAFQEESALGVLFGAFFSPILEHAFYATLFLAAGCVALRHGSPRQGESLELLLRGRWRAAELWASAGRGLLLGFPLALVPYGISILFPGFLPFALPETILSARWPAITALWPRVGMGLLGWVVLVMPLMTHLFRKWRWVGRGISLLLGALLLAPGVDGAARWGELLVVGLVLAAVLGSYFHRWGAVEVLAAVWGAQASGAAAVLLLQPGGYARSGWLALGLLLGLVGMVSVVARRAESYALSDRDLAIPRRLRAERERIKAQLSVAEEAQRRMLPAAPPHLAGFDLAASCRPAREVGGDLYDFIPFHSEGGNGNAAGPNGGSPDAWGIALGDVSGKGMVASLYMTLTKGLLLAAAERSREPCTMLAEVNRGLYQESDRNIFVTLWYGVLNPASRTLRHVRAGHNPALWRRAAKGETVALKPPGFALGGTSSRLFNRLLKEEEITLEPGDALFVYSDGITEAMNDRLEEYGDDRLRAAVERTDGMTADRAMKSILADVHGFIREAPQHDDMTIVVLRVEP